jgi:hypothetical protein
MGVSAVKSMTITLVNASDAGCGWGDNSGRNSERRTRRNPIFFIAIFSTRFDVDEVHSQVSLYQQILSREKFADGKKAGPTKN